MMKKEDFHRIYMSHLNAKQQDAVQLVYGPTLLLAVPGSGKTTVLVNRIGYMIYCEDIKPENILTLTYTVAATNDMKQRFVSIFGNEFSEQLEFRTINGICAKIIQRYSQIIGRPAFDLLTDDSVINKILVGIMTKYLHEYPTESDIKGVRTLITYCKNMVLTDAEIGTLGMQEQIPLLNIYRDYNSYLKENLKMDYDDQMIYAYMLLKQVPDLLSYYKQKYQFICVDEAQDTSKIQHIIIGLLAGQNGNLFMVGDEDQSIYGFRAAYPEALLNFEQNHPEAKVLVMDMNYRSNANIVAAADGFIQRNKSRHEKHIVATKEANSTVARVDVSNRYNQYNYLLKVAENCERETAVLYRDNESVLPLVDLLDRNKIDYRIKGTDFAFFTNRVVVDVTNILKFAMNQNNKELFMKIYFKFQTFLKKAQAEMVCKISARKKISILEAVQFANVNDNIKKQCISIKQNLDVLIKEKPGNALIRIENNLHYGKYLERNNISDNKLQILKMLAKNEITIVSYLDRLAYMQDVLKRGQKSNNCQFILSTIHSSKGLEYDQVYMLDVYDGVFPDKVVQPTNVTSVQEMKLFEEERRLFYVGMTRAKNDLNIFRIQGENSQFLRELFPEEIKTVKKSTSSSPFMRIGKMIHKDFDPSKLRVPNDEEVQIGKRVVQKTFGPGEITHIKYGERNKIKWITVLFDNGYERMYVFRIAFETSMIFAE